MSIVKSLVSAFKGNGNFTIGDAYEVLCDKSKESIRARIYEQLGVKFEIGRNLYCCIDDDASVILFEGNSRELTNSLTTQFLYSM